VDFRSHTYNINDNGDYTIPYGANNELDLVQYWYPILVGSVTRYILNAPSSIETCSLSDSLKPLYNNPLFAT